MKVQTKRVFRSSGQIAIEYMLLLGLVAAIVLVGLQKYVMRTREASNIYFNKVVIGLDGPRPRFCGDGLCTMPPEDPKVCCTDCGGC